LLLGQSDLELGSLPREQTVIWRLVGGSDSPAVPTFRFGELQVFGGWTPYAERIATILCEEIGAHFVFESRGNP
jgi:hypothetical protein